MSRCNRSQLWQALLMINRNEKLSVYPLIDCLYSRSWHPYKILISDREELKTRPKYCYRNIFYFGVFFWSVREYTDYFSSSLSSLFCFSMRRVRRRGKMCALCGKEERTHTKEEKNLCLKRRKFSKLVLDHFSFFLPRLLLLRLILAAVRTHLQTTETYEQCYFHHHDLHVYHCLLTIYTMIQRRIILPHPIHVGHAHQQDLVLRDGLQTPHLLAVIHIKVKHRQTFYIISIHEHSNQSIQHSVHDSPYSIIYHRK